jgi:hypothetical protein
MADTSAGEERRCRCGHDKRHSRVRPGYHYGIVGSLLQIMGVSAVPTRIDFECGKCGEIVGSIVEPALLEKYRVREPKPEER